MATITVTKRIDKGSVLTHTEMDDNLQELANLSSTATDDGTKGFHLVSIPRTAGEVLAGVTPTNSEYPEGHFTRYGITGDGSTDDRDSINECIASASAGDGSVYVPRPSSFYAVSDYIILKSNVRMVFESNSFITLTSSSTGGHVIGPETGESITNVALINPHIDGGGLGYLVPTTFGDNGIGITKSEDIEVIGGIVQNCRRGTSNLGGKGVQVELDCKNILVSGVRVRNCTKGFNTQGSDSGTPEPATNIIFDNMIIEDCWQMFELDEFLSPAEQSRDITSVVIGNVIGRNCGIKDYSSGVDTGAFVIQRYAYAKIGNVMLANDTAYGTIPAFGVIHRSENIHGEFSFFGDCTSLLDMEDNASFGTNAADGNSLNVISIKHTGSVTTLINSNAGGSSVIYDDNDLSIVTNDSTATIAAGILTSSNTNITVRELTTNKQVSGNAAVLNTLSISDFSGAEGLQVGELDVRFGRFGLTAGASEDRIKNLRDVDLILQRNSSSRLVLKSTTINIPVIPTSASGLASGDIWSNSGTLTIV